MRSELFREVIRTRFAERASARLAMTLANGAGAAVPVGDLSGVWLTLYDLATGDILNSRNRVDVAAFVDVEGRFAFELTSADMALVNGTLAEETHVALVEWQYNGGASRGYQEVVFRVVNLAKV